MSPVSRAVDSFVLLEWGKRYPGLHFFTFAFNHPWQATVDSPSLVPGCRTVPV